MTVYILMGVAGCGKSTVGRAAADILSIPFLEGDKFHPEANLAKMASGYALTNEDRMPWVDAMIAGCKALDAEIYPIILACSALSIPVRQRLREGLNNACRFIHLHGHEDVLIRRLSERKGHFFKANLLTSQFVALDIPREAITLDLMQSVETLAAEVCDIIRSENEAHQAGHDKAGKTDDG